MPKLLVEKGPNKGQALSLGSLTQCVIGREPGCQFVLNDSNVSRRHAELIGSADSWIIKDLGSRNGTYVNGKRIEGMRHVALGDRIQVGEILISFLDEKEEKDKGGLIGQRLGGYRILERLGRGGMGTVYKANQLALNREVALKVLSPDLVNDPVYKNLFIAEARAAAALNHPNIVQVHDVGVENGLHYFSMEYMMNGSVHDIISRDGRLTAQRALKIAIDAAAGLSYAERKGIVHRDIKPENLMVSEANVVKIGDLGLALDIGKGDIDDQVGMMGTPHFCAPEQVTRGKLDHRTDLYALGATMYRIMAGKPPFVGQTLKEILVKKVKEKAMPLSEAVPGLPPAVSELVMQLLEKDPALRPQSAEEVRGRIEAILPDLDMSLVSSSGGTTRRGAATGGSSAGLQTIPASPTPTPISAHIPSTSRPNATVAWFAVSSLLLMGAIGGFGWMYLKEKEKKNGSGESVGPLVKNGGGPGDTTGGQPRDPADAAMLEVDDWVTDHAELLKTPDGLRQARQKYLGVADSFKDSPRRLTAERKAKDFEKQFNEISAQKDLDAAEAKWAAAEKEIAVKRQPAVLNEVPEDLEKVAELWPDTSAGKIASTRAGECVLRKEELVAREFGWQTVFRDAGTKRQAGHYVEAIQILNDYAKAWPTSPWTSLVPGEVKSVEDSMKSGYDRLTSVELPKKMDAKAWAGARELLEKARPNYDVTYRERFDSLLKSIDEFSKATPVLPPPALSDAEIEADALGKAEPLARDWDFTEAAGLCRIAISKLKDAKNAPRLDEFASDCETMEVFKRALRARVNGSDREKTGLRSRSFRGSTLMSANDDGLKLADGSAVPWGTLKGPELFRLSFSGWEVGGREALGAGLLCGRLGAWRCARFAFAWGGSHDKDMADMAHLLIERSSREERSIIPADPTARQLLDIAQKERADAEKSMDLILKSFGRSKDLLRQGQVYSCMQFFESSDKHLSTALAGKLETEEEWEAHIYLMFNSIQCGDEDGYREHAFKARDMLPAERYSDQVKEGDKMWNGIINALATTDEIRESLLSKPTEGDAKRLLEHLQANVYLKLDQRIAARWMCEVWPNNAHVKTGEPLRIWAESCRQMKDYFLAKKYFERLKKQYRGNPMCQPRGNDRSECDEVVLDLTERIKRHGLGIRDDDK